MLELAFFATLAVQSERLQQEYQSKSRSIELLAHVSVAAYEVALATGCIATYAMTRNPIVLVGTETCVAELTGESARLKSLAEADADAALKKLSSVLDDLIASSKRCADMLLSFDPITSYELMDKMNADMTRLHSLGVEVSEGAVKREEVLREKQVAEQGRFRVLLAVGACGTLLLAVGVALGFSLTLGRRFKHVNDNAILLGIGQELKPALKEKDELAKLDRIIHQVASDLVATRRKERALIDNTAEIIFSIGQDLRISQVNSAISRRLGYDPDEVIGHLFVNFVIDSERETVNDALKSLIGSATEASFECQMREREGRIRVMEVTAQWYHDEKSLFCVVRDISARKEAELLKQEVLAMVSHDLRTPLASLIVSLQMMRDGLGGALNDRGSKIINLAISSIGNLNNLTSDLLDMESHDSGLFRLHYETVNLSELIAKSSQFVVPQAQRKNITMINQVADIEATIDADRIGRVVTNLLSNAIKYSPSDSSITIDCNKTSDMARPSIELRVTDEGAGIDKDKIDLLFQKYRQLGQEGERGGSGLGLAICKAIVEAHGGTIGVDSTAGEGSTFWFKVPSQPASV